jgi:hypothetical protein
VLQDLGKKAEAAAEFSFTRQAKSEDQQRKVFSRRLMPVVDAKGQAIEAGLAAK